MWPGPAKKTLKMEQDPLSDDYLKDVDIQVPCKAR